MGVNVLSELAPRGVNVLSELAPCGVNMLALNRVNWSEIPCDRKL